MIPSSMIVFINSDIISSPPKEYELGKKKSTVGWIKYYFLWNVVGEFYFQSTLQSEKDYAEAIKVFKRVNRIPISTDLHDWEDVTSVCKQQMALNKFRKELGYIVEYNI